MAADIIEKGCEAYATEICEAISAAQEINKGITLVLVMLERDSSLLLFSIMGLGQVSTFFFTKIIVKLN